MYQFFVTFSRAMAILGGLVLSLLILLICVSILGRAAADLLHADFIVAILGDTAQALLDGGIGPVNGDYELVEAGIAFSIFAFLPLTQISGAHATVDIFTSRLSPKIQTFLRAIIEIGFAALLVLIALQLGQGMFDKMSRGQTTFLLQFPVWWAYGFSLIGAAAAAIVGVYVAFARTTEVLTGRKIIIDEGADH